MSKQTYTSSGWYPDATDQYGRSDPQTRPVPLTQGLDTLPPPPAYTPRIGVLPCVIPQIATNWQGTFMCPFARAYSPELQGSGISEAQFLKFIDGFNEAFVASPILQLTNMAGMVMGQVHGLMSVQLAGTALSVASGFGSAAVSITRVKAYMKGANEEVFHPAGLHAQVLTTKKMLSKIGYPAERIQLLPVDHNLQSPDVQDPAAAVPGRAALSRRHQALDGYVQPLTFDVAPSVASDNLMERMGEWQAKKLAAKQQKKLDKDRKDDEKKSREKHEDVDKEQRKLDKEVAKLYAELEKERSKADRKMAKDGHKPGEAAKIEREFQKEQRKIEQELAKKTREGERKIREQMGEGDNEMGKSRSKEEKIANKIRWIVITPWVPENAGDEVEDEDHVGAS